MRTVLSRTRGRASAAVTLALSGMVLIAGCGAPDVPPPAAAPSATQAPAPSPQPAGASQPQAAGANTKALPAGTQVRNPANGRLEVVVPDISKTVLLIGDSQSAPQDGWPRLGLASAGYSVYFCGLGGTGYVAANGGVGNYIDALLNGNWLLPSGTPAMIVIQGGGNDAGTGASNSQISANADRLIAELKTRYLGTRIVLIGTLAKGAANGGGRRTEVDTLLGSVAAAHGLPFISAGDWLTKYGATKDLADAVHMNPAGRKTLGKVLDGKLRELNLERKTTVDPDRLMAQGSLAPVGSNQD